MVASLAGGGCDMADFEELKWKLYNDLCEAEAQIGELKKRLDAGEPLQYRQDLWDYARVVDVAELEKLLPRRPLFAVP